VLPVEKETEEKTEATCAEDERASKWKGEPTDYDQANRNDSANLGAGYIDGTEAAAGAAATALALGSFVVAEHGDYLIFRDCVAGGWVMDVLR
jgi:hypothetical protein